MWLMYPIDAADVRNVRRAMIILAAGSILWYTTLILGSLVFADLIWGRIYGKFVNIPLNEATKKPLIAILMVFALFGAIRYVGYRLCRNVLGGMGVPESETWAAAGTGISICAVGTVYFGFTGLLALTAVAGAALELKFLRFPATLFGMVVSPEAVRRVNWYFYARTAWMSIVVPTALIFLVAQILNDIPKIEGGPLEHQINAVNSILFVIFKALSVLAIVTLPVVVVMYFLVLYRTHQSIDRILDPNGPKVQLEPVVKPGFDQLKQVLQPQDW
ncbi:MAG: hypothetical protein ACRC8S_02855 [Fimbriiglobus sp.]